METKRFEGEIYIICLCVCVNCCIPTDFLFHSRHFYRLSSTSKIQITSFTHTLKYVDPWIVNGNDFFGILLMLSLLCVVLFYLLTVALKPIKFYGTTNKSENEIFSVDFFLIAHKICTLQFFMLMSSKMINFTYRFDYLNCQAMDGGGWCCCCLIEWIDKSNYDAFKYVCTVVVNWFHAAHPTRFLLNKNKNNSNIKSNVNITHLNQWINSGPTHRFCTVNPNQINDDK